MAGHSKWAQIKRQKGVTDAKRGALFTKLTREIMNAAREGGGGDPALNFRLRLAVQRAKAANMPNDNIDRAIARATGAAGAESVDEITYEGYGPGGTAILVTAMTDNKNRTVAEVRHQFSRAGGSLGEAGSVAWQFDPRGVITVPVDGTDPDEAALVAIDAGADDVQVQDDSIEVQTEPANLEPVRQALETAGLNVENADFAMVPKATIPLDEKTASQTLRLLDALEELDDVVRVYSNAEFSDETLAAYAS
jgi:YebC/PmpR family DNA-binding regulatory protein